MAKNLVAKVRFDDGSKKGSDEKSKDYEIGEAYKGDSKSASVAVKAGLICEEAELKASKEVLDEKDKVIKSLEAKIAKQQETITALENKVSELVTERNAAAEKAAAKK